MLIAWLAVGLPFAIFLLFGVCYSVAIGARQDDGKRAVDRRGQVIYLAGLLTGATVLLGLVPGSTSYAEVGIRLPSWPGPVALATAVAVLVGAVVGVGTYVFDLTASAGIASRAGGGTAIDGRTRELVQAPPAPAVTVLVGVGTAVFEEVVFRGIGMLGLAHSGVPVLAALAISSVMFGLSHVYFGLRNVALKAVAGLVWGALVLTGGSVLAAVFAHLAFQGLALRRLLRQQRAAAQRAAVAA